MGLREQGGGQAGDLEPQVLLSRKFSWRVGSALRPKQHAERRRSDLVESIRRQRELVAAEREAEWDASIAPSTPTSHGLT